MSFFTRAHHLWRPLCLLITFSQLALALEVTGAQGGLDPSTGARPLRIEISDFSKSGPAFDLFVLAMDRFQAVDQYDPLSYFQISGVHGFPQIPWDGVIGNGSYPGYCTHAATLFPTWHRAYLALFEQLLWDHAQEIAAMYPEDQRDAYQDAALSLRVPYWDWTLNPVLPTVVSSPEITVNTPEGSKPIDNPLYQYNFQADATGNGFPASDPVCIRHQQ